MQAHMCSSLCSRLPKPGTYPGDHEERLSQPAAGEEISASRKQCNKSTPVRERVPTATNHTAADCFRQFYKTCPTVIENEMEMGKLQIKKLECKCPDTVLQFSYRFSPQPQEGLRKGLLLSFPFINNYTESSREVSITHSLAEGTRDTMGADRSLSKKTF